MNTILIILAILLGPLYIMILSAAAYYGKVLVMRKLFHKGERNNNG